MSTTVVHPHADVVLIGGGVMSATLAAFLPELQPDWQIQVFERLDAPGLESSNTLNNAGTGHSALCELNYTPQQADGSIDISQAIKIMEQFETSKQFRAYLTEQGYFGDDDQWIHPLPHMSVVFGDDDVDYLRQRHQALSQHHLFSGMHFTTDHDQLRERFPLIMQGRHPDERIAATRAEIGTEINFGLLTQSIIQHLDSREQFNIHYQHDVIDLHQNKDSSRTLDIHDRNAVGRGRISVRAKFVFIGSGGSAITLLSRSGIPEAKRYAGFPVDGQRLICNNPDLITQHHGKVYAKPQLGAPPMSTPHLDTRYIHGKKTLLFGPYAGFTTKFLKKGSILDLFRSLTRYRIWPMLQVAYRNLGLVKYLIDQVIQRPTDRLAALQELYPQADLEDRHGEYAGKRVQIIKRDPDQGAVLQFGTEVVVSADKTISALLGASPGASTSVHIMLDLLRRAFPDRFASPERQRTLDQMVISHHIDLHDHPQLAYDIRAWTHDVLGLTPPTPPAQITPRQQPGIRKPLVEQAHTSRRPA